MVPLSVPLAALILGDWALCWSLVEVVLFAKSFRGFPWDLVGCLVSRATFGRFLASVLALILCNPPPPAAAGCLAGMWRPQCCEASVVNAPSLDLELQPSAWQRAVGSPSFCGVGLVATKSPAP